MISFLVSEQLVDIKHLITVFFKENWKSMLLFVCSTVLSCICSHEMKMKIRWQRHLMLKNTASSITHHSGRYD